MFQSFSVIIFVEVQMVLHLASESLFKLASVHFKCYPGHTALQGDGGEFLSNFFHFFY